MLFDAIVNVVSHLSHYVYCSLEISHFISIANTKTDTSEVLLTISNQLIVER